MKRKRIISDTDKILTAAKYGSFSRAAKELGISQAALSRGIASIEEQLHVSLFVRASDGVQLSAAGKVCAEHLWKIREAEEDLKKSLDYLRSSLFQFNIALPLNVPNSAVKVIESKVHDRFPSADIRFINVFSNKVPDGLLSGQYDIAISWNSVENDSRYTFEKYYEDHLLLLEPSGKKLIRSHRENIGGNICNVVNVQDLQGLDFVLQDEGTSVRRTIDTLFRRYDIHVNNRLYVSNSMMAIKAVENRLGCALVMEAYSPYYSDNDRLSIYVLNEEIGETIGLIKLQGKELSPLEEYAAEVIRKYLEERRKQYFVHTGGITDNA